MEHACRKPQRLELGESKLDHNPLEDQHANLIQILQTNMNIQKFESASVDVLKLSHKILISWNSAGPCVHVVVVHVQNDQKTGMTDPTFIIFMNLVNFLAPFLKNL